MRFEKYNSWSNYPTFHTASVIIDDRQSLLFQRFVEVRTLHSKNPGRHLKKYYETIMRMWKAQLVLHTTVQGALQMNTEALLGYVVDSTNWDTIYLILKGEHRTDEIDDYDQLAIDFLSNEYWRKQLRGDDAMDSQVQRFMREQVYTWAQDLSIRQSAVSPLSTYCRGILSLIEKEINWDEIASHLPDTQEEGETL